MEHFVRLVNAVAEADKGHGHESEARYELAEHTLERFSLAAQQNCERRKYRRYDGENWDEHKQISFLFAASRQSLLLRCFFHLFPIFPCGTFVSVVAEFVVYRVLYGVRQILLRRPVVAV